MRTVYTERLWPAAWLWTWGALVAVTLGIVFVPATSLAVAAAVGAAALVGTFLLLRAWSPVVRVVEPEPGAGLWLQAGDARIPAVALGELEALDAGGHEGRPRVPPWTRGRTGASAAGCRPACARRSSTPGTRCPTGSSARAGRGAWPRACGSGGTAREDVGQDARTDEGPRAG